jgi:hypothetical protein
MYMYMIEAAECEGHRQESTYCTLTMATFGHDGTYIRHSLIGTPLTRPPLWVCTQQIKMSLYELKRRKLYQSS